MDWMKWLFSTWTMIRLSGLTGHFFLTLSVLAGLLGSFPALRKQKACLHNIHLYSGWAGLLAIVLHATLIVVDTYAPLSLLEILIPGTASYEPLWNAFGTISLYLFGFVLVTSDFLKEALGKTLWKLTHSLVLPAWLLMNASRDIHRDGYRNTFHDHLVCLFDTDIVYTDFVPDAGPSENSNT